MLRRFSASKCNVQCKLCLSRVKLMRNKRTIALKQLRKDVADLLRSNKQESARIRVEAVLRETNLLQAYEILELYLELLAVRAQLVEKSTEKEPPLDMQEALSSLIYASTRVQDLPELGVIRGMLASRYDKAYIADVSSETTCNKWSVNENLHQCLVIGAPKPDDKLALLSDIAQEHGVEWDLHGAARDLLPPRGPPSSSAPSEVGEDLPFPAPGTPSPSLGPDTKWTPPPGGGGGGFGMGLAARPVVAASRKAAAADEGAQYADAQEAAAAAQLAAQQAQHAADEAQRHANNLRMPTDSAQSYPPTGPNIAGGSSAPAGYGDPQFPDTSPFKGFDDAGGPSGSATGPKKFVAKSNSQIQREYDAAPGPPSKDDKQNFKPLASPTAPPATHLDPAPTPSPYAAPTQPPPVGAVIKSQDSGLPPVPGNVAQPPPEKPIDEVYRRFAALKNN